jgi:hypothetical protein
MKPISFRNAYYIKLGQKGMWEKSSFKNNIIRIGWNEQSTEDINQKRWGLIQKQLYKGAKTKAVGTRDFNDLKRIVESDSEDIWITFYSSQLWWCNLGEIEIFEDNVSKYRKLKGKWYNHDINDNLLTLYKIPGILLKLQGYRGTVCSIKEKEELKRLINSQKSESYKRITTCKKQLEEEIITALNMLHWKDFELLVDLIFRNAGWRRISVLGETMRYIDIELEEPITGDIYQVQVKSTASKNDFQKYIDNLPKSYYRKVYFVVHSPEKDLELYHCPSNVELILPFRLAQMIIEYGLLNWFLTKVK